MRAAALIALLAVGCVPKAPLELGALGPGSALLLLERDGDRTTLYGTELTAEGGLLFGAPPSNRAWILAYDRPLLALGFKPGRIELEPAMDPPNPDARRVPVPLLVVQSTPEGKLELRPREELDLELAELRVRPRYSELLAAGRCLGPAPAHWNYQCPDVLPAQPALPSLPSMTPCAPGFEAQSVELHAGFVDEPRAMKLDVLVCAPSPSECPGDAWPSLDGSGCRDLRVRCRGFPAGAPNDALYVDAAGAGPGTGTQVDPYSSLDQAIDQAARGATIAVAAGEYSLSRSLSASLHLWGACPGNTEIALGAAGLEISDSTVELRDLSLVAPLGTGILARSSTLTLRRTRVAAARATLGATGGGRLIVEASELSSALDDVLVVNGGAAAELSGSTLSDGVIASDGALTITSSWIGRRRGAVLRAERTQLTIQGSHLEMPLEIYDGALAVSDSELAPTATATVALVVRSAARAQRVLVKLNAPELDSTSGLRFIDGQTVVEDLIVRRPLLAPAINSIDNRAGLTAIGGTLRAARVVVEGGSTFGILFGGARGELEDVWLLGTIARPAIQILAASANISRLGIIGAAGPGLFAEKSNVDLSDVRISLVKDAAVDVVGGSTLTVRRLDLDEYAAGGLLVGTANQTSGPEGNVFRGEDLWVHGPRQKPTPCIAGCPEAIYIYSHTRMSLRRFRVEGARIGLRARRTSPLGDAPLAAEGSVLNCVTGLLLEPPQGVVLDPEPYLSVVSAPSDARRKSLVIQPVSVGSAGNDRL